MILLRPELEVEVELREQLRALPLEQKREVLDFVAALRAKREAELDAAYAEMAADEQANAEALEWCEGLIGDIYNETP